MLGADSLVGDRRLVLQENVAERKTQVLPTGGQQDDMGSSGAVPKAVPGGLWRIRNRLVNKNNLK